MPRLLRFIIMNAAASPSIVGGTERRVSSPSGIFSTLITSAPMSASISVQVGPAMTWVRSITFRPSSGPIGASNCAAALRLTVRMPSTKLSFPAARPSASLVRSARASAVPRHDGRSICPDRGSQPQPDQLDRRIVRIGRLLEPERPAEPQHPAVLAQNVAEHLADAARRA